MSPLLAREKDTATQEADENKSSSGHIPVLDAMRGIAALSVCWFHFTNAQFSEVFSVYKSTGTYGWLGVSVFFVISGFLIPHSLWRAGYSLRSFYRFLLKRIVRLDPPYLASIAIVLCGYYVSSHLPGHRGPPFKIPWPQLLAHLGYANAFIGLPWLQMTYWSLAIEFQYYIFIGLLFPLVARKGIASASMIYVLFGTAGLLLRKSESLLPFHLPIFLFGIVVFRYKSLNSDKRELWIGFAASALLAVLIDGYLRASVGLLSALAILLIRQSTPLLTFLGTISYSIYLIHVYIGQMIFGMTVNVATRIPALKCELPIAAVAATLVAAYVLHALVETPSKMLSKKLRY